MLAQNPGAGHMRRNGAPEVVRGERRDSEGPFVAVGFHSVGRGDATHRLVGVASAWKDVAARRTDQALGQGCQKDPVRLLVFGALGRDGPPLPVDLTGVHPGDLPRTLPGDQNKLQHPPGLVLDAQGLQVVPETFYFGERKGPVSSHDRAQRPDPQERVFAGFQDVAFHGEIEHPYG